MHYWVCLCIQNIPKINNSCAKLRRCCLKDHNLQNDGWLLQQSNYLTHETECDCCRFVWLLSVPLIIIQADREKERMVTCEKSNNKTKLHQKHTLLEYENDRNCLRNMSSNQKLSNNNIIQDKMYSFDLQYLEFLYKLRFIFINWK